MNKLGENIVALELELSNCVNKIIKYVVKRNQGY
jgi:hypothetical protein